MLFPLRLLFHLVVFGFKSVFLIAFAIAILAYSDTALAGFKGTATEIKDFTIAAVEAADLPARMQDAKAELTRYLTDKSYNQNRATRVGRADLKPGLQRF